VFPPHAHLSRKLNTQGLHGVRWISPTRTRSEGSELNLQDVEAVCAYLSAQRRDFFVLGSSTYLYGINAVVPPQPLLYFQKHHYFLEKDYPWLDRWILESLRKRDIRLVVREKENFQVFSFPFPESLAWIEQNFKPGPVFGNFEIFLRP
jgi:hypothetical protein